MKRLPIFVLGAAILCCSIYATFTYAEDSSTQKTTRSSRAVEKEQLDQANLLQVLANQEEILTKLDQIMEELKVVKVRATLR